MKSNSTGVHTTAVGAPVAAKSGGMSIVQRMMSLFAAKYRKNDNSLAIETINPLFNLDVRTAQMVFDCARQGNYAQIQYIYNEIERTDPTLLVCVTRRASALSELDWKVVESDQRLHRGTDPKLVKEQIACVEEAVARIENFPDAVEHLALAAFRGFAHVTPLHGVDGSVRRLDILDNWNFCFDREQQTWLWNPSASYSHLPKNGFNGLKAIPRNELVSVVEKRAIDWPAIKIFLRTSIGERDWGRFLETYGMPPVIITMPEFTSESDEKKFVDAAESVFEGRNGVVPYGSSISWASESRGTNPFTEFIEHQQKLIVLMATGGTLTSLAESGSGTLAGGAQMDVWRQIVRRDTRIISNAVNKQLCEEIVRKNFKGQPILARFELDTEPKLGAKDVLELAQMANGAGLQMDVRELSEQTGYTLTRADEGGGGMGGMGGFGGGSGAGITGGPTDGGDGPDGEPPTTPDGGGTDGNAPGTAQGASAREGGAVVGGNSPDAQEGRSSASGGSPVQNRVALNADAGSSARMSTPAQRLAWSLQADFKDVADRLNEIINLPEEERPAAAERLIGEIDSLVPEDPAMAAVIAEQMMSAFKGVMDDGGDEVVGNSSAYTASNVDHSLSWYKAQQESRGDQEWGTKSEGYRKAVAAEGRKDGAHSKGGEHGNGRESNGRLGTSLDDSANGIKSGKTERFSMGLDVMDTDGAINECYRRAEASMEGFSHSVESAAAAMGITNRGSFTTDGRLEGEPPMFFTRTSLKNQSRVREKLEENRLESEELGKPYNGMNDIVDIFGSTIVMGDDGSFDDARRQLEKAGLEVVRTKNCYQGGAYEESGYGDVKFNVRTANGFVGEVICMSPYMCEMKMNGPGHAIYELSRSLSVAAKSAEMSGDKETAGMAKDICDKLSRLSRLVYIKPGEDHSSFDKVLVDARRSIVGIEEFVSEHSEHFQNSGFVRSLPHLVEKLNDPASFDGYRAEVMRRGIKV